MSENNHKNKYNDVGKESILYNAKLVLDKRTTRIPDATFLDKAKEFLRDGFYNVKYYIIIGLSICFCLIFLSYLNYDQANYTTAFSAIIQATSTIFAIAAAGTLLLVERIESNSPTLIRFLPTWIFVGLFGFFGVVVAVDILVLPAMPIDSSYSWILNLLITLNVGCVIVVIFYVKDVMNWMKSKTLCKFISEKGRKTESKNEAINLVRAIEELGIRATMNHDFWTVSEAVGTCIDLSNSFCETWNGEKIGFEVNHPVRVVARIVTKIGHEAICSGSDHIGGMCVDALCYMANFHDANKLHMDVWIFSNISHLAEALIEKKSGSSVIYTLALESKVAIDQGRQSLCHWIIVPFNELARYSIKYSDYECYRDLCIAIEILLDVFSSKAASVYSMRVIHETLEVLEDVAKIREFGDYKGYLGERGWKLERTQAKFF